MAPARGVPRTSSQSEVYTSHTNGTIPTITTSSITTTSSGRHIHAKEKDILHKTLGTNSVTKPKKPVSKAPNSSHPAGSDSRSGTAGANAMPATSTSNVPRPIWLQGPGTSEQRMKWSSMSIAELNTWRNALRLPISAPFSSEQACISLTNPDTLGSRTITMSSQALPGRIAQTPQPRVQVERAISMAFENVDVDEEEFMARFIGKCDEERKSTARGAAWVGERDQHGGGTIYGTGGKRSRPIRCRSDMLA